VIYGQIGNSTEPQVAIHDMGNNKYGLVYRDLVFSQLIEYKSIYFESDSQDFQEINQAFKQFFNSPANTKKEFNLDNNKLTLQTRLLNNKNVLYVRVTDQNNESGLFKIENISEIDELFPLKSRSIDNDEIRNKTASLKSNPYKLVLNQIYENNKFVSLTGEINVNQSNKTININYTYENVKYMTTLTITNVERNTETIDKYETTGNFSGFDKKQSIQVDFGKDKSVFISATNNNYKSFTHYMTYSQLIPQ
jgi:hypothetical protein